MPLDHPVNIHMDGIWMDDATVKGHSAPGHCAQLIEEALCASRPRRAARPCRYWLGEEEEGIWWRQGVRQSSKLLRGEIALNGFGCVKVDDARRR
jgi:hypothetical protein